MSNKRRPLAQDESKVTAHSMDVPIAYVLAGGSRSQAWRSGYMSALVLAHSDRTTEAQRRALRLAIQTGMFPSYDNGIDFAAGWGSAP
jgi:hypothetical protein